MKQKLVLAIAFLLIFGFAAETTLAQFNIKIPKINKPKTDEPKSEPAKSEPSPITANDANRKDNSSSSQPHSQTEYLTDPEEPKTPQFLLETLEIKAHNESKYAKAPTQNDYSSWIPQVDFDVLYSASAPHLRYQADWFNPDGSLWFSEPLEFNNSGDFPHLRSPYESVDINPRAIIALGIYGLKITDTKTNQTIFQGKFKVNKMLPDPTLKNKNLFYVENDWNLPVGYVGFKKTYTDYNVHTRPMVFFWFKGIPETSQMEAELYLNNQKIATTDKGGHINKYADRGEDCYLARNVCADSLIGFEWEKFVVDNAPSARQNNPNGYFTNDHPGEYTVKVFSNGDQVREAKFTIDAKGRPARNAFSDQIFLNDYRVIVPVKVLGTTEKWNAASWKTDTFYGNLLKGFVAP